jgi:hypothetical protein
MVTGSVRVIVAAAVTAAVLTACTSPPPSPVLLDNVRTLAAAGPTSAERLRMMPRVDEQRARRRALDADQDGALDPAEYLAWEWESVLRSDDVSQDGLVSEAEYILARCPGAEAACVGLQHRRFTSLDRSRDGSIDRWEFAPQSMAWYVGQDHNRDCRIAPAEGPEPRLTKGPLWPCDPLAWLKRAG